MLCTLAVAAFVATGIAQTNVTSKLHNADMELGVLGWDVNFEGTDLWKKVTKNQATQPAYYGISNVCLEVWKSNNVPITNNSISQTLKNLPNGTYVFGAYMVACDQSNEQNREIIEGVSIFANDDATPVATNSVQGMTTMWGHAAKFNVATVVTDGTLKVGVNIVETNATFVLMDNAMLYYFGEMDPTEALDEMAEINIAATIAIADTCLVHKMNADVYAVLNDAVEAGKELVTYDELYKADEEIYWGIRQALSSIKEYAQFAAAIKAAQEAYNSYEDYPDTNESVLEALAGVISEAQAMYDEGLAELFEIEEMMASLSEAVAYIEIENIYKKHAVYDEKLGELEVGDDVGEYSEELVFKIQDYLEEVLLVLSNLEEKIITAEEAIAQCEALFARIEDILANPNTTDEFPITIPRGTEVLNNTTILRGSYLDENGLAHFKSKTYHFDYPLQKIRFIIKESGANNKQNGYPFTSLSEFAMYDEAGDLIELSEENVTSNADHNKLNPSKTDGGGIPALFDENYSTFFHSAWQNGPAEAHYIEVTLPQGEYSAFSFTLSARSNSHTSQFPAVIEIIHLSEAAAHLQIAVAESKDFKPYSGVEPGFYNTDVTPYKEAFAAAEALIGTDASDAEIYAAINKLEEERTKLDELGVVLPDPEKEYRVIAGVEFFNYQGVHKAITVLNRNGYKNQLGWETACPDSLVQLFKFEPMEAEEGKHVYAMKHVATGMYVSQYYKEDGSVNANAFGLSAEPEEVELVSLGVGQFAVQNGARTGSTNSNMMHTNGYNNGLGNFSTLVKWKTAANSGSAWFIREMSVLPKAVKSISDLDFESESIHLYEAVNTITLTADKECAFDGLKLYSLFGDSIPATTSINGASATIMLDSEIETFAFAFNNAEGVANVTVNASISSLSLLQEAYTTALAIAPVMSDKVGDYNDLSEYEAALDAAENLLASGATDEAIQKAIADLEAAVANLGNHINYPDTDKTYFILAGYGDFKSINGIDMAIYAKEDALGWSYVNIANELYLWNFVAGEPTENGKPTYFVKNASTGMYVGTEEAIRLVLPMVEKTSETIPYQIYKHTDGSVALANGDGWFFHFNSHGNGAGVCGDIIYWNGAGGASAVKIIEAEQFIEEYLYLLGVEHIDITDEYVAPAVKGTFDLFGRRIDTPSAAGIYIVNGKKVLIK